MSLTITEALAETKTIEKRITKKRDTIGQYLGRQEKVKDPLASDGGSVDYIKREEQAVNDLEERLIAIRRAILTANQSTIVSLNGDTRSIQDWLTWRREVAPKQQAYLARVRQGIESLRKECQQKGLNVVSAVATVGNVEPNDVWVNLSEVELAARIEKLEAMLGDLDGQLSLKNATTMVNL